MWRKPKRLFYPLNICSYFFIILVGLMAASSCERYSMRDHVVEVPETVRTVAVLQLVNYSYDTGPEHTLTRAIVMRAKTYGMKVVPTTEGADLVISGEIIEIRDRAETLVERRDGTLFAGSNRVTVVCTVVVRMDGVVVANLPHLVLEEMYPEGSTPSETRELRLIAFERIGVELADRVLAAAMLSLREDMSDDAEP